MSITDIILLAIGIFFVVRGILRGISGEIFSLLGTAGAFYCAVRFYSPIGSVLQEKLGLSATVATILTMLAIFFVIFFGCTYLEWSVKKVIEKTRLTATDKLFGAGIGVIKFYMIALLVLISSIILAPMTGDGWVQESRALTLTAATWPLISPVLDKAGLIPDVAAIQNEARDYVIRQAGRGIIGTSGDMTNIMGAAASGDIGDISVISEDANP
ncbi:MAG: CvpA family protein [Synergistaceae bacterium]|jgi:membrane protein required for colicin V production|nr:CvpA family protein [Synergistaceae bacterium]